MKFLPGFLSFPPVFSLSRVRRSAALSASVLVLAGLGCATKGELIEPPAVVFTQATLAAVVGHAIVPDGPMSTGPSYGRFVYTVSPALPTGLSINSQNGTISGTPVALSRATTYQVAATNANGSSYGSLSIAVAAEVPAPTNLSYASPGICTYVGVPIPPDDPTVNGPVDLWTVAPALPAGLSIDPATGIISGTATAVTKGAYYTVTATNSAGSTNAQVHACVEPAVAPSGLTYPTNPLVLTVNAPFSPDQPFAQGTPSRFSITPELTAGIQFDPATGIITGVPTAVAPLTTYTLTATNSAGSTSTTLPITVQQAPVDLGISYNPGGGSGFIIAEVEVPMKPLVPTSKLPVTSWTIFPALPLGLTIDPTNGIISGTPLEVSPSETYRVTGTGPAGSSKAFVDGGVGPNPAYSTLKYADPSPTLMAGQRLPADLPDYTGTASNFSVTPALPAGLVLDPATGAISGTPTGTSPATIYVVSAEGSTGNLLGNLSIAVSKAVPSLLELGHGENITFTKMASGNLLSLDIDGHWNLWNYATAANLASGDQDFNPLAHYGALTSAPVDIEGPVMYIGIAHGAEIRSSTDGHLLTTIASNALNSPTSSIPSWSQLSFDGSYLVSGSQTGILIWTTDGTQVFSEPGDYSQAIAFAAAGQLQIAKGPAGAQVIETIAVPSGKTKLIPFTGGFETWFTDGAKFLTTSGNAVSTFTAAGDMLATVSMPDNSNLHGQGNWIYNFPPSTNNSPVALYAIGANTPTATYTFGLGANIFPTGLLLGVSERSEMSGGNVASPQFSVIDLSGTTPNKVDYPQNYVPVTFAALSPTQWLVGKGDGVILDPSVNASPRLFDLGEATSISGAPGRAVVATASGTIFFFDPATGAQQGTIPFTASKTELSADGTVLAAQVGSDSNYNSYDRTLNIYTLPAGTLAYSFPSSAPNLPFLNDFTLSASGTTLGRVFRAANASAEQVSGVSGTPSILSASGDLVLPIQISPDGTLVALPNASQNYGNQTTTIFKGGPQVATVNGTVAGWLDNNRVLSGVSLPPYYSGYDHYEIYDAAGNMLATVPTTMRPLSQIIPVDANTVYVVGLRAVYNLTTGLPVWQAPIADRPSAPAGPYVVYGLNNKVLVDTY